MVKRSNSTTQRSLPGLEGLELEVDGPQLPAEQPLPSDARESKGSVDESQSSSMSADATGLTIPECSPRGWTVYLVDAHSLIFQVFHALPEMTSPGGEHVGAVYGFVRDILYLVEEKKPDALICAFDLPGRTFRDNIYDAYKADREQMPSDLVDQIPKVRRFLEAMAIPVLSSPGFEADDVLATVSRVCDEMGAKCLIVSGDKDCRQLISDHVAIFNIRKNQVFDAASLHDEWGIRPDQVVDYQSLVGDKVDNVPGVPTIGPKTAQQLLTTYETLDEILTHAEEVPGAKGKKLAEGRASALLSRELVRLDRNVPVDIDWSASRVGGIDHQRLMELFVEFGFRTFTEKASRLAPIAHAPETTASYHLVDSTQSLAELCAKLARQPLISVDTETTHVNPRWAELVGLSFSFRPGEGYYVPVRGPIGEAVLDLREALEALRPVLENPAIKKIGQNLKYDIVVLKVAGVELQGIEFDTMVASYLLDAGDRNHSLDALARRYLDHTTIKIDELIGKGRTQKRMDEVPIAAVTQYAAEDADIPLRMMPLLSDRLKEATLSKLNDEVEVPLIGVLADMEFLGVRVDPARLEDLSERYGARLSELEKEIERLAGHSLNIASPKQLAHVLFQELSLPVVKKTKTGPSTDADVLEQLAELHPLPAKIVEYRQFAKLKNTYVDALPAMIHPRSGRVHASFNQVVAATGRLSSSDPNLQNIPIRTAVGREIRSAFVPGEPGWKLMSADYSQIELRVLAHFCQDDALINAFANDEDIHTLVASQVFGVSMEDVSPEQRRSAKAVNFGIIYGQSPFGLAKSLGISQDEAAAFIDGYFAKYPGVGAFFDITLADCFRNGAVSTLLGRRRAIQGVRSPESFAMASQKAGRRQLILPERTAVNTVIQGSAADLIKLAMIAIHRRLKCGSLKSRMILQIHDELVFEAPYDEIDLLGRLVHREMQEVLSLRVPLKVDVKWGDNWAECEPWTA